MDTVLITLLPFLAFFVFFLVYALRRVPCPDCGDTLPVLRSPFQKTRRMWLSGGYLCARCGCETNMSGHKVTAETPPVPFPTLQVALLAIALLVGIGLATTLLYVRTAAAPPIAVAAPPVVEPQQLAPVVAPVN